MMKRSLSLLAAAALTAIHAGAALAASQAGVTAAVRGDVDLLTVTEQAKHKAASGEDVFLGDEISSHDESGMQLMLLDETVFTIGANTDLTIDAFVYDPATGAGEVTASLAKGVLRFVTGKIAEDNPQDVTINLPVGTIGIRGTFGAALFDGVSALVVLLGPGFDNNADARQGRLAVTAKGKVVNLVRPGYGTEIERGKPPTDPFRVPEAVIELMFTQLGAETTGATARTSGGTATKAAGQDVAAPLDFFKVIGGMPADPVDDDDDQDSGELQAFSSTTGSGGSVPFGITTFDELRSIQTGVFFYNAINPGDDINVAPFVQTSKLGNPVNIPGHFHAQVKIDFGAQVIGGSGSFIQVDTIENGFGGNISDSTLINAINYANETDIFAAGAFDSDELSNSNFAGTFGALLNTNGIIANQALLSITYSDGSGNDGSGGGISDPLN